MKVITPRGEFMLHGAAKLKHSVRPSANLNLMAWRLAEVTAGIIRGGEEGFGLLALLPRP